MSDRPIKFSDLSLFRSPLMGAAMLMVILFHVGYHRHDTLWFCIGRCGNVGVDLFLFLSGIGMWFAWDSKMEKCISESGKQGAVSGNGRRNDSSILSPRTTFPHALLTFYFRRFCRIYPAWLIMAGLYYIPLYLHDKLSLADTVLGITVNWGFWEHGELTFWFIPAIMVLYTVAPFYMELIRRRPVWRWLPVLFMVLCVLIQYWPPLHHTAGHLEIFFSRIPIFLLGVNAGQLVKDKHTLDGSAVWMLLLVFFMSAVACVNFENGLRGSFPLFLERMVYIPLTVSMLFLLCRLLAAAPQWLCRALSFVGGISLEMYLIHAHFVYAYLRPMQLGFWPTALLTIIITAVLAWLLHKLCSPLSSSK